MPSGCVKAMEPPLEKWHMISGSDSVDRVDNSLLGIYLFHRYL